MPAACHSRIIAAKTGIKIKDLNIVNCFLTAKASLAHEIALRQTAMPTSLPGFWPWQQLLHCHLPTGSVPVCELLTRKQNARKTQRAKWLKIKG